LSQLPAPFFFEVNLNLLINYHKKINPAFKINSRFSTAGCDEKAVGKVKSEGRLLPGTELTLSWLPFVLPDPYYRISISDVRYDTVARIEVTLTDVFPW